MVKRFKNWVVALIVALVLVFVLQNTESVSTRFLFMEFSMPRAFLLFVVFLLGGAAGFVFSLRARGSRT